MRNIVGLCGLAGAGKDTVASFFMERNWIRVGFADALYREVAEAFGVSVAFLNNRNTKEQPLPQLALANCDNEAFIQAFISSQYPSPEGIGMSSEELVHALNAPRSPRTLLQLWGTEFRRAQFGDDYWRVQVARCFEAYPEENFIITDVRFPDEAKLVEQYGGSVVRVVRPELKTLTTSTAHSSEQAMAGYPVSQELINLEGTSGLAKLRDQVIKLLEENCRIAA